MRGYSKKIFYRSLAFVLTATFCLVIFTAIGTFTPPRVATISIIVGLIASIMFTTAPLASSTALVCVFSISMFVSQFFPTGLPEWIAQIAPVITLVSAISVGRKSILEIFLGLFAVFALTFLLGTFQSIGTGWLIFTILLIYSISALLMQIFQYSFLKAFEPISNWSLKSFHLLFAFLLALLTLNLLFAAVLMITESWYPGQYVLARSKETPMLLDFLVASIPLLVQGTLIGIEPQTLLARALLSLGSFVNFLVMIVYVNILLGQFKKD